MSQGQTAGEDHSYLDFENCDTHENLSRACAFHITAITNFELAESYAKPLRTLPINQISNVSKPVKLLSSYHQINYHLVNEVM